VRRLSSNGIHAEGFPADAGDPLCLKGALEEIEATLGSPSVLIYNAVSLCDDDLYACNANDVIDAFEVSVLGALTAIRTVVPSMRAVGGGTIIITSRLPTTLPSSQYTAQSLSRPALGTLLNLFGDDSRTLPARVILANLPAKVSIGAWHEPRTHMWLAQEYWSLVHTKSNGSREVTLS
jgi:NAD(P)-dependent dehydrogenase (short-subunit alcohol dehydrogenase family)